MWNIKYCGSWNYRPQAESLSAEINNKLLDTCEIEEGETGQFELFRSGESFIKAGHGKFITYKEVIEKLYPDELVAPIWIWTNYGIVGKK